MIHQNTPQSQRTLASRMAVGLASVALCAALALTSLAQAPSDSLFRDFEPNGEFALELDGKMIKGAEIFQSKRAGSFLIMAPELSSPVLLNFRAQQVQGVHIMKVARRDTGSVDILADASFDAMGGLQVGDQGKVRFNIGDRKAVFSEKPPLVGWQSPEQVLEYKVEYVRGAAEYTPSAQHIKLLQDQQKDVEVKVYFGTWCPACTRYVPKVLKMQEGLGETKVKFSYYGLPRQINTDPVATEVDIKSIPTVDVHLGGKKIGRFELSDLNEPEKALHRMVAKAK